ncbi:retrovirus-related Pol polyprotein from transposon opus [Trichonephila clavipes]|nr:retrovirus-related Pol polyprotein from transposon opus [Trichonephila clavipes]
MTPVDLPYVPILLNETFITALWDSGAEKSFISEEVYRKYFSYRPGQKTKDRVVTAHGAPCCHLGYDLSYSIPYASPVVLTRKNNDLPPDSPETYQFAIDYRKLNAITEYPRYPLPKKEAKFNWSTEAQDSFDKIKRALTDAPVLQLPNFTEQFNLFTDASGVGISAVLNQNQRPIAFASRTLHKVERNYTVNERECLAVIWALNKLKTYFGSLQVKVITDHAALTKLTNGKNLSSRMIRWALKLSEFIIQSVFFPGIEI